MVRRQPLAARPRTRCPRDGRGQRGQALVEFSLVMPLLMTLLLGVVVFGVAFNQYLQLTGATSTGTRQLAISRGETTDPCSTAVTAIEAAAPNLTASKFTFAFVLNTTSYSGTSCSGAQTNLLAGQPVEVTVTYPCNVQFFEFRPTAGCTLQAQSQARVQ